jgi:integrase
LTRSIRKEGQTFHSLRSSFITFLEQGGAPENITAAIVGHKIQTMSYGLYSGGPSYDQKKIAINLIPNIWPITHNSKTKNYSYV